MGWTVLQTRLLDPFLHPARERTVCEGLALVGDKEKYLDSGMNDYVSKPVRIQELEAVLEKAAVAK